MDTLLKDWEYTGSPVLPPRSRLYHLAPIGVGTPMVESLTSYICRLAAAHSVTPWMLVTREVSPLASVSTLQLQNRPGGASCSVFVKAASSSLISNGRISAEAISVLEKLTGQTGLASLTLLFTEGRLSSRDLLAAHQRWCPQCLQSWLDQGKPVYFPLIWNFQHVKVCLTHQRELEHRCPHCDCQVQPLARRLVAGFCPHCLCWLGSPVSKPASITEEQSITFQHIQQLLMGAAAIQADGEGGWCRSIDWLIKNWFKHAEGFAHDIGVHPSSVRGWLANGLPSLTSVLSLALQLRVSLMYLLLGNIGVLESLEPRSRLDLQVVGDNFKRHHKKHDVKHLKEVLDQAVASDAVPPISLASISRQTGVHLSFLSRKFPIQSAGIKERYRAYRNKLSIERIAAVNQVVHETVDKILAEGKTAGASSFRKTLPAGYSPKDFRVITAWRRELKERNIKPNKS